MKWSNQLPFMFDYIFRLIRTILKIHEDFLIGKVPLYPEAFSYFVLHNILAPKLKKNSTWVTRLFLFFVCFFSRLLWMILSYNYPVILKLVFIYGLKKMSEEFDSMAYDLTDSKDFEVKVVLEFEIQKRQELPWQPREKLMFYIVFH